MDNEYVTRIMRAVWYIEKNLHGELDIAEISRKAAYSRWHFQKLFYVCTGFSVMFYIKKRRLSEAYLALCESSIALINVAFDAGFESQEAFTRAFKGEFNITPGQLRREKVQPNLSLLTLPLGEKFMQHLQTGVTMQPRFVTLEEKYFVGLATRFIGSMSPAANNMQIIPALWDRFFTCINTIQGRVGEAAYGLCIPLANNKKHEDELEYIAGVEVKAQAVATVGMKALTTPGGKYAVFTHRGLLSDLDYTVRYVFGVWLEQSGYILREAPDFELYDSRFSYDSPDSEIDIYVPIE